MEISVRAHVDEALGFLDVVHHRHIPFAHVYAATLTANDVKSEELLVMREVFDRPTPYVMNALQSKSATKGNPVAYVGFNKDPGKGTPAKRFLNPNIHGGERALKSTERQLGGQFFVPGRGVPRDGYGNVRGSVYRRILSQLKVSTNVDANASDSRRSKAKRKNDAYFKSKRGYILHRTSVGSGKSRSDVIKVVLVPIKAPNYVKRFPFYETAERVVDAKYPVNFKLALDRAIATSNFKGRWS